MTLKACIMTLACLFAAAVQAQQALPDSTAPVALEPMKIEAETLKRLPVRGVQAVVGLMPGVVSLDGNLHMRGGRADEIGYTVNGMNVNRPMDGSFSLPLIHNAIESISVYSGGYNAGQDGRLSGLVEITTKTGGDRLKLTGEIISDDFWKVKGDDGGLRVLGLDDTYSYGYNDYVLTVGGPVPGIEGLRFFTAGQVWNRASEATRFEGFQQNPLQLVQTWYRRDGHAVTDTLDYSADIPPGRLPGGGRSGRIVNSSLNYQWQKLSARLNFNSSHEHSRAFTVDPTTLTTTPIRPYKDTWDLWNADLHLRYSLGRLGEIRVAGGYYSRFYEGADSKWGDDLEKWGNPELNPALLDASVTRSFDLPFDDAWTIPYPGTPAATYQKNRETRWQFQGDVEIHPHSAHTVRLGMEYREETVRRYSINARGLYRRLEETALNPQDFTEYDIYAGLSLCMIGYDWLGREVDHNQKVQTLRGGLQSPLTINIRNRPMTPRQRSFYLEDEIALDRIRINAGLRYDRFSNGWFSINDWTLMTQVSGGVLSEGDIRPEKTREYWSPRFTIAMPMGRHWSFSAHLGRYIQQPNASDIWGKVGYTTFLSQLFRSSYFLALPNPNLKATESRVWEMAVSWQPSPQWNLSLSLFQKEITGMPGDINIIPRVGATYAPPTTLVNEFDGEVRGLNAALSGRLGQRAWLHVNYSLQHVLEEPVTVGGHRDICWACDPENPPDFMIAADQDINHSVKAILHYESGAEAGFECRGIYPLANVNCDIAFSAQSGRPYTRIGVDDALSEVYGYNAPKPLGEVNGSHLLWNWQVDLRVGKAFRVGPVNLEAYLWAINLFDWKAAVDSFRQTGSNTADGWLLTDEGEKKIADKGEEWVKWYNADLTGCGTFGWQPPRQLRAGLRFER